jgi:hypothetical protein
MAPLVRFPNAPLVQLTRPFLFLVTLRLPSLPFTLLQPFTPIPLFKALSRFVREILNLSGEESEFGSAVARAKPSCPTAKLMRVTDTNGSGGLIIR